VNLAGHLRLVCALDGRGVPSLREQSFAAPAHISKPFLDEGALVVNVMTPTAGLFDGDRLQMDAVVESGARLVIATPAASRVHRMRGGEAAVAQRFEVASGGSLEILPDLLIPQAETRYRQETKVFLHEGCSFFLGEMLAPGRVASGEIFAFASIRWETELWMGGSLFCRERFALVPGSPVLAAARRVFSTPYFGTCFVSGKTELGDFFDAVMELHEPRRMWAGAGRIGESGGGVVRLIACDGPSLRAGMEQIRAHFHAACGTRGPSLRRIP
jgi:urease accessory protein